MHSRRRNNLGGNPLKKKSTIIGRRVGPISEKLRWNTRPNLAKRAKYVDLEWKILLNFSKMEEFRE